MFDKTDGENNCFNDYNCAIETFSEEQIIFVLAEDSYEKIYEIKDDVCLDYKNWYEHVLSKDNVILDFTTKKEDSFKIKDKFERNICNGIRNYRKQLIDNVP